MSTAQSQPPLLVERQDGIGKIVLNRPDSGNGIDLPMVRALFAAVCDLDNDASVRCILLTGAGRFFCVGGDVSMFASVGDNVPAYLDELAGVFHMGLARLAAASKPVITAINGPAAGAGLSLAISGDLVIASRTAHFTAAYGSIGLTPDGGMTWLLPRLVGLRCAQDMILTDRRIHADEALALGLVTRLADAESLAAEADKTAKALARRPMRALGAARRLLQTSFTSDYVAQLEREQRAIVAAGSAAESREGIAAFLAKRLPDFEGI